MSAWSTNCMNPPTPTWGGRSRLRRYDVAGQDRDDRARAGLGELHGAALEREQREVLACPDVVAGVDLRADLADEDVAREHELAVVALDAAALAVRVATVAGAALTLLVCHFVLPNAYMGR